MVRVALTTKQMSVISSLAPSDVLCSFQSGNVAAAIDWLDGWYNECSKYRVWPDGTVQDWNDEPYQWMSDDFAAVSARNEDEALVLAGIVDQAGGECAIT